jgi:hypothetical protein
MLILVFSSVVPSVPSVPARLDAHMCVMMHNLDSQRNLDSGHEQMKKPALPPRIDREVWRWSLYVILETQFGGYPQRYELAFATLEEKIKNSRVN